MKPATQKLLNSIQRGDVGQMREAVREGADINHANALGATALMQCIRHHFHLGALALIEFGADIHALDDTGSDALIWAALERQQTILDLLVEAGSNIHQRDEDNDTALIWAARNGLTSGVAKLLDAGSPVNALLGREASTALIEAMRNQHLDVGLLLMERGADPEIADAKGFTVWHYAFEHHIPSLRAAVQANEIARQTPAPGPGRSNGRL